jgi:hypothetical protein
MRSFVALVVVALFALILIQPAAADDAAAVPQAGLRAASVDSLPVLVAQSSSNSSSSGSTRIPRGLIRLAIFGVIALFGAGAWVVRQVTGSS